MSIVIKVENLSKSYTLKHQKKESYVALRDVIAGKVKDFLSFKKNKFCEVFWALQDINFSVNEGDRIGIIGRNGAGKSTLLKILSRITEPTKGRISIEGRIASLLEVGTGFHPELSGRENIYLNGSILGMSKAEIKRKFDEIVAFSEVEQFLDTPVKRYSSGMYVRLAFAVAAHLEPEILIVDEVLAVGDVEFQKKCLGKMKDVSGEGRTVLFVSHNMAAIQNLCEKCLYLKEGEVQMIGETSKVISTYLRSGSKAQTIDLSERKDRSGNGLIRFQSVELKDEFSKPLKALQNGKTGIIHIRFQKNTIQPINNFHVALGIDNEFGQRITQFNNETTNQLFNNINSDAIIEIKVDLLPLKRGRYSFVLYSTINNEVADWIQNAGTFDVEDGDFFNTGKLPPEGQGNFYINHSFQLI